MNRDFSLPLALLRRSVASAVQRRTLCVSHCIFLLIVLAGCASGASDPHLKTARAFLDTYYVMADQRAALPMTIGRAADELQNEIKLLEGVANRDADYRSREVLFELKNTSTSASETHYFFELRLIQPDGNTTRQMVHIVIDAATAKVSDFRNIR